MLSPDDDRRGDRISSAFHRPESGSGRVSAPPLPRAPLVSATLPWKRRPDERRHRARRVPGTSACASRPHSARSRHRLSPRACGIHTSRWTAHALPPPCGEGRANAQRSTGVGVAPPTRREEFAEPSASRSSVLPSVLARKMQTRSICSTTWRRGAAIEPRRRGRDSSALPAMSCLLCPSYGFADAHLDFSPLKRGEAGASAQRRTSTGTSAVTGLPSTRIGRC